MTGRMIWHPGYGKEGTERVNVTVTSDKKPKRPRRRKLIPVYQETADGSFTMTPEASAIIYRNKMDAEVSK